MAKSGAATVDEYLAELPEDRRAAISAVREVVLRNLPDGYVETMNWGLISYEIPLERYPRTYNKQPLTYAALGSQKNYCAVYLMSVYTDGEPAGWFEEAFKEGRQEARHGQVLRPLPQSRRPSTGRHRQGDRRHHARAVHRDLREGARALACECDATCSVSPRSSPVSACLPR